MLFAHGAARKGLAHEHGAAEMLRGTQNMGDHEVILKCDGEPALRNLQEDVKKRREGLTILDNPEWEMARPTGQPKGFCISWENR